MDYKIAKIEGSYFESIKQILEFMCKENKINKERQEYKVLFSNEKLFPKNNKVLFTSGSKKYLSFYGKAYLSQKNKITETVYLENETAVFDVIEDSILMIVGGVSNSTSIENEEDVLYFYIAPTVMLDLQEPGKWQDI